MNAPRMCPICGMESIEPIVLDAQLSVSSIGQPLRQVSTDIQALSENDPQAWLRDEAGSRIAEAS